MIQGTWQINNELRLVMFKNTLIKSEWLFNIEEFNGSFSLNLIPDDPPRWTCEEESDHNPSIHWKINRIYGDMVYIRHIPDTLRETIIVTEFPFSNNNLDTLHKV